MGQDLQGNLICPGEKTGDRPVNNVNEDSNMMGSLSNDKPRKTHQSSVRRLQNPVDQCSTNKEMVSEDGLCVEGRMKFGSQSFILTVIMVSTGTDIHKSKLKLHT